jgi:hypothetical protein
MRAQDPVAKSFVDAAVALRGRQLWRELDPTAAFLIRHPDEPHSMAAVMPGAGDQKFVFLIYRGPVAFADLVAKWRSEVKENSDERNDQTSSLGVGFTAFGELTRDERQVMRDARAEVELNDIVPFAYSKSSRCPYRLPSESELNLIADCARAILATHAAGEFRPRPLNLKSGEILEVKIEFGGHGMIAHAGMVHRPIYLESGAPRRGRRSEAPPAPEEPDAR